MDYGDLSQEGEGEIVFTVNSLKWHTATVLLTVASAWAAAVSAAELELWPHVSAIFPQADRLGAFEGKPPAAPVYDGEQRLGYVFLTDQIAPIRAYSGQPVSTMVALTEAGKIQGVRIVHHLEPILQAGISEQALRDFVAQYQGLSALQDIRVEDREAPDRQIVDGISGATITVMVVNASITESLERLLPRLGMSR